MRSLETRPAGDAPSFAAALVFYPGCGKQALLSSHPEFDKPMQVLLGKRRRRLITGRRLRQICLEACGLPEWLFDACHSQVGDSAETVALLWPAEAAAEPADPESAVDPGAPDQLAPADQPLSVWMEQLLPAAAALEGEEQAAAVRCLWRGLAGQHDMPPQFLAGSVQHPRQLRRLVDFPVLLRRQTDACPVGPAALVAAAFIAVTMRA